MRGLGLFSGMFKCGASGSASASSTILTVNTSNAGVSTSTQFKLPLIATGSYYFTVFWGDGTSSLITTWNQGETLHDYGSAGIYNITITGPCIGWAFAGLGDCLKLTGLSQWGSLRFQVTGNIGAFQGCQYLRVTATDAPNLAGLRDATLFFSGCYNLCGAYGAYGINGIESWDVSTIQIFDHFFESVPFFNQNIGAWNVSSGISFSLMFNNCFYYDNAGSDSINNWDVSHATNLSGMFQTCQRFYRTLSAWNVGNCTNFSYMFHGCGLNCNLGSWNTGRATDMEYMFYQSVFDNGGSDSINSWDVHGVTNMGYMFANNSHFARNIGSWNVSAVTNMYLMFNACTLFDCDLSAWNVSHVGNMSGMFYSCGAFTNGGNATGMSVWDVTACAFFSSMFQYCGAFNPPMQFWSPVNANYLNGTLSYTLFKGSLASWVIGTQNMQNLLSGCDMNSPNSSTNQNNYNATLIAWNTQGVVNRNMGMGSSKYTIATAGAARTALVSRGCSIVDGGGV